MRRTQWLFFKRCHCLKQSILIGGSIHILKWERSPKKGTSCTCLFINKSKIIFCRFLFVKIRCFRLLRINVRVLIKNIGLTGNWYLSFCFHTSKFLITPFYVFVIGNDKVTWTCSSNSMTSAAVSAPNRGSEMASLNSVFSSVYAFKWTLTCFNCCVQFPSPAETDFNWIGKFNYIFLYLM
jgi:hypothetical protein